jgi:hypothetical protein
MQSRIVGAVGQTLSEIVGKYDEICDNINGVSGGGRQETKLVRQAPIIAIALAKKYLE